MQPDPVLLGESLAIRRLRSQIQRIAPYFRTALVRGETGSGKQLVARAIHALSPIPDGPFIVANAIALAESIAKGESSRTASSPTAVSLLNSANGGTLYLDSVGELPFTLQAALFRFIRACEERRSVPQTASRREFRRTEPARIDTRILASTDRDLRVLAAIGQFRQDLYARLSAVEILVPPLRQRVEDIPALAAWLLRRIADETGQAPKLLAKSTLVQLQERLWPNNLRELERVIAQAAALAEGAVIEPRHMLALVEPTNVSPAGPPVIHIERLHDVIQQHVLDVLTRCGGNKLRAAEQLGISRSTLYRMLDASSVSTQYLAG
jgi:DNA-binding NtrC family response regulator